MESSGISDGRVILDWLAFTLPYDDGLTSAESLFGGLTPRPMGTKGYARSAELPCGGVVSWSPEKPEQKVHVDLSSQALGRALELNAELQDIGLVLRHIQSMGGAFTRTDWALDDHCGRLSMDTIGRHVSTGRFTMRWRKCTETRVIYGGCGRMFQFGLRASDSYMRIYDKRAERLDKGKDDPGRWIRVELELKRERAAESVRRYVSEGVPFIVGLVRGLIEFKELGEGETKTRWPICDWWGAFLDQSAKARLSLPEVDPTIERTWEWLWRQLPRSLARVIAAEGGDIGKLQFLLDEGYHKLTESDRVLIEQYLERQQA